MNAIEKGPAIAGRVRLLWLGVSLALAFALSMAPAALGSTPLSLARFSMQPIESEQIVPVGVSKIRVEKVPYAFTQAGGHPWGLTTTVEFTSEKAFTYPEHEEVTIPTHDPKDVVTDLPTGLLGNPNPTVSPRCPLSILLSGVEHCPADTQVGVARLRWFGGQKENLGPIVNVTPEVGQSAEFGIETGANINAILTAHVIHSNGSYGLTVVSNNIPINTELVEAELTFWGVPADPSHDQMRGMFCVGVEGLKSCSGGGQSSGVPLVPFLSWPTDCTAGQLGVFALVDSWEEPASFGEARTMVPGVTGCNSLRFAPELDAVPDVRTADEPVGLGVDLKVPQSESADAPSTPEIRDSVVTLPEGLSINPSVVDGVQACDESGPSGINFSGPESEEKGVDGEPQLAAGHCPDASIIGTAEAESPLLAVPVKGHVYLARPGCGGAGQAACTEKDALDGTLYQLYLELGGTGSLADTGVNLKVRGRAEANPATGQLTTVFEDTPQLPFSELRIRLNGGPRAPLANPWVCGPSTTTSHFTPWSSPGATPDGVFMPGTPDAISSSFYEVDGCEGGRTLNPGFLPGMAESRAGQFSSFSLDLLRKDREPYFKDLQLHMPPGLLGMLATVPLCGEPDANDGTCPLTSKIGTTRAASGAGSHPFEIEGGTFLTGPYRGAPFGLSIVTQAVAGPFNLGRVIVRARIDVDQRTSALTVTVDESGPRALPQIIYGVPLRLQRITVNIDRPRFMFNPTNCNAMQIAATIAGSPAAVANVSSPFAVGGCDRLAFDPRFSASTSGHTSRAKGANLDVKLSYPTGALGTQANIARVKVSLPKQLPSRLTTLQKACPAAVFDRNPTECQPASIVGVVRASTPLLPVGLAGPVYFVSHGGEAFPSLVIVLQGDGVRVDLSGTTFISKAGITSSTFETIPDVPVNTFELFLPQGRNSALASSKNLCAAATKAPASGFVARQTRRKARHRSLRKRKRAPVGLVMPTEMIAQNGAVIHQNTRIEVTGCRSPKSNSAKSIKANRGRKNDRQA